MIINLYPRESECIVCGVALVNPKQSVPVYEGEVLPNDWSGPWAGFDACQSCFEKQQRLVVPCAAQEMT